MIMILTLMYSYSTIDCGWAVFVFACWYEDEGDAEDDEREGSYYGFLFWTERSCDKILYTGFCVGPPLAPVLAATAD